MPATTSQSDHQDWLGTERARTSTSGAVTESFGSLPFGDDFTYNAPEGDWSPYHFAGYDQDRGPQRQVFVAGVEDNSANGHAQFREYSNMAGRWFSPDPYQGSYDPNNPQSFNRYAYVLNNPLSFIDPSGLFYNTLYDPDPCDNPLTVALCFGEGSGPSDPGDLLYLGGSHGGAGGPSTGAPNNGNYVSVLSPKPTIKQLIVKTVCGNSPSDPIIRQMKMGAVIYGPLGAGAGAIGAGGMSFGMGAVPGALLGGFVGGTIGAAGGVIRGGMVSIGCSAFGVY